MKVLKTSLISNETRPKNKFKKDISAQIFEREFMAERDKTKFNPVTSDLPIPKFVTRAKHGLHKTTIGSGYMRESPRELSVPQLPEPVNSDLKEIEPRPLPEPNGKDEDPTPLKSSPE